MNGFGTNGLTSRWPFALERQGLLIFVGVLAVALLILLPFDRAAYDFAHGLPDSVRGFFKWVTRWGLSDWVLIPSFVVVVVAWLASLLVRDLWRAALREGVALSGFVFVGVGLPGVTATLLKRLIGRGRPETWTEQAPLVFAPNFSAYDHQSFPSGHATTGVGFAIVIALIWPRLFWPAVVAGVLIALSRVVVGAHYPTDILGGAMLGTFGAFAVRNLFAHRGWLFTLREDGGVVRKPFAAIRGLFRR